MERILLVGAETVESAGHRIASAADEMSRAVANFDGSLHQHRIFMEDWLSRFQSILEQYKNPSRGEGDNK